MRRSPFRLHPRWRECTLLFGKCASICFSLMVALPSLCPGPVCRPPGLFFATRFFQIFIKFFGGAVFLYSIGFPDFLKFDLRVRNSVHATSGSGRQKGVVGDGWGQAHSHLRDCQGSLETRCGILDASIGGTHSIVCLARSEVFSFGDLYHD